MQQTIRIALDKGHELTPEIVERLGRPAPSEFRDLRLGVIWIAVAVGLASFGTRRFRNLMCRVYSSALPRYPHRSESDFLLIYKFTRKALSAQGRSSIVSEDHHLVTLVVSGQDTAAFGELVRRHQSQVRNFLRKLAGERSLADDLAQDCFLHAWDKLHTYSGSGSFIGWLLKGGIHDVLAIEAQIETLQRDTRIRWSCRRSGVETCHADRLDEVMDLERLLAVLSEEERSVMVMSYACGLSHKEISDATDMPVGTVKSIIFRGKEKIRNRFDIKDHQHG